MIHSYNKNNSEYDFFGLNSDKKKKKTEPNTYPYRAVLNYDSAPSLLGEIPSSDNTPSLFAPRSEGERIRKTLQSAVDKALGKGKYSGLFDGIDTKKIEENIPLAESVIKKNKQKNAYSVEDTKNLPYLRDGLAAFYALSEAGNHKAANLARKIAYTPVADKKAEKNTVPDFFDETLKKPEVTPAVYRGNNNEKTRIQKMSASYTNKIDLDYDIPKDEYFVFGKEEQPAVVPKSKSSDNYTEYLSKKEILPDGILKRYVLSGKNSRASKNQIISTSEAATLAADVYSLSKHNGSKPEGVGEWVYDEQHSYSNSEGLQIAVFSRKENGKTYYAVVNAGTEGKVKSKETAKEFIRDWTNNLQQSFGLSDDMKDSIEFAQKFVAEHPDAEIIFIGHSKGGAEAAANAVATNCNAIIFNPARANYEAYGLDRDGYTGNITAFVVEGEPLDAVLDFISFFPFIPQQETNTYELKKEKSLKDYFKNLFGGLKYNLDEWGNLHNMQTTIDILSRSDKK